MAIGPTVDKAKRTAGASVRDLPRGQDDVRYVEEKLNKKQDNTTINLSYLVPMFGIIHPSPPPLTRPKTRPHSSGEQ